MRNASVYDEISLSELSRIVASAGFRVETKTSSRGVDLLVLHVPGGAAVAEIVSPGDRESDRAFRLYAFLTSHSANWQDVNEWNCTRNFAKMTIAGDGSLCLEHFVFLQGGVAEKFIGYQCINFGIALKEFFEIFET